MNSIIENPGTVKPAWVVEREARYEREAAARRARNERVELVHHLMFGRLPLPPDDRMAADNGDLAAATVTADRLHADRDDPRIPAWLRRAYAVATAPAPGPEPEAPAPVKMTKAEAGRLGGRQTFERHGAEHMRTIGRKGFAALATFARGGRSAALARLAAKGRITPFHPATPYTDAEYEALFDDLASDRASEDALSRGLIPPDVADSLMSTSLIGHPA